MADSRGNELPSQIDIEQILLEARHRWLRSTEVCEILRNFKKFCLARDPPHKPAGGSLFLFDRKTLRNFRKDGLNWKKKKDGITVMEGHEKLKAGSVDVLNCYYARGKDNKKFQRRCYWMLDEEYEYIVLVHYRDVKEGNKAGSLRSVNTERGESGEDVGAALSVEGESSSAEQGSILWKPNENEKFSKQIDRSQFPVPFPNASLILCSNKENASPGLSQCDYTGRQLFSPVVTSHLSGCNDLVMQTKNVAICGYRINNNVHDNHPSIWTEALELCRSAVLDNAEETHVPSLQSAISDDILRRQTNVTMETVVSSELVGGQQIYTDAHIQALAHARGHQVRKNYLKIIWLVGIVEKAILRWGRKGVGLRGFRTGGAIEGSDAQKGEQNENDDYDFLRDRREQMEAGVVKALARVHSMVQYPEARHQYRRLVANSWDTRVDNGGTSDWKSQDSNDCENQRGRSKCSHVN